MVTTFTRRLMLTVCLAAAIAWPLGIASQARQAPAVSAASTVPEDLKPLLTPRRSELRLVTQWYT